MVIRLAAPLVALAVVACGSKAPPAQSVAAAMQAYVAALKSNDPAAVSGWWTDDLVYMPAGGPTVRGRAAFDSVLHVIFRANRVTDVVEHTDEILVDRDLAVQIGTYSETLQPTSGTAIHETGRYTFVWRRQPGGAWKIARGMGSDLPEPAR